MHLRSWFYRILFVVGLLSVAMANSSCETTTYVGVGVGYGAPGYWGGGWTGGYAGGPIYR